MPSLEVRVSGTGHIVARRWLGFRFRLGVALERRPVRGWGRAAHDRNVVVCGVCLSTCVWVAHPSEGAAVRGDDEIFRCSSPGPRLGSHHIPVALHLCGYGAVCKQHCSDDNDDQHHHAAGRCTDRCTGVALIITSRFRGCRRDNARRLRTSGAHARGQAHVHTSGAVGVIACMSCRDGSVEDATCGLR
jgi:hypothetical protein